MENKLKKLLDNRNQKITFRSFLGLSGQRRTVCPVYDKSTYWYKGVEPITDEMKKSGKLYCDPTDLNNPTSTFHLCHKTKKGQDCTLDLSKERDYLIAKWLFESYDDIIAISNRPGQHKPTQLFYVYNEALELKEDEKNYESRFAATDIVRNLSPDELMTYARLLGYRMEKKKPNEVRIFLYKMIDDTKNGLDIAKQIKDISNEFGDGFADLKMWAYEKIDNNIIVKRSDNSYWYGEHKLGFDFMDLVNNLRRKSMADLIVKMDNDLEEKERMHPSQVVSYRRPAEKTLEEEDVVVVDPQAKTKTTVKRTTRKKQ